MRFIHTGDTHIGEVYKDEGRNQDIKDAFRQVIDAAIENKVDFIIHSGDIFDTGNPSLQDLLFLTDQLHRLKENNIKLFTVPGSHDIGMGEELSVIEFFDRNNLLVNLNSPRYIKRDGNEIILSGEEYAHAFIAGIRGKRSRVEDEIFDHLKVQMKNAWIKIFIFHHTISALGEPFSDLQTEKLPKGFDYYAAGHWHGHYDNIPYDKGIIQYPGSTEYCDEKEMTTYKNRGFYLIDYDENGIKSIAYKLIKTRDKQIIDLDVTGQRAQQVFEDIRSKLRKNGGDLLIIRLSGKLEDKRSAIDIEAIKSLASSLGYAYTSINTSKLGDKSIEQIEVASNDIVHIEREFLSKKGYDDKDIQLAQYLIDSIERGIDNEKIRQHIEEEYKDL